MISGVRPQPMRPNQLLATNMKNNSTKPTRYVIAAIVLLLGISGSYFLISNETIGEMSFLALVTLNVFTSLVIGFSNRINQMKLSQFEVKFNEIKETEASVKEVAGSLLEYIDTATESMVTDGFDQERYDHAREKVKELIR